MSSSSWLTLLPASLDWRAAAAAIACGSAATLVAKIAFMSRIHFGPAAQRDLFEPTPLMRGPAGWILGQVPEMSNLGICEASWIQKTAIAECLEKGRKAILTRNVHVPVLVPIDPRDIEYMMLHNGGNYVKPSLYEAIEIIVGEHGIFTMRDEAVHAVQRRLLNPAFASGALRGMADTVVTDCVDRLMTRISAQVTTGDNTICLEPAFDDLALNVVANAAFRESHISECDVKETFLRMTHAVVDAPYLVLPHLFKLPSPAKSRITQGRDHVRQISLAITNTIREARAAAATAGGGDLAAETAAGGSRGPPQQKMLVDYMIDSGMDDAVIADNGVTFLLGGHESTATTLVWAAYYLARNPAKQAELFDEVSAAFAASVIPDLDTARSLPFLTNCVKETLRLVPPADSVNRLALTDDILPSGVFVPAGTEVYFPIFGMHHNAALWGDDVEEFRPERWDDVDRIQERVGAGGYLPFFLGKRNCIGREFAMNELLIAIATFVRRFEIRWPEGAARPLLKQYITVRSEHPIHLHVIPR